MITKNRIRILEGDITRQKVDAIVNAANASLLGGGGVDGAIHRAAGPELLEACKEIGGCPAGEVRVTPGFHLPAQYVFHTVGPVWSGGTAGEPELLASCYRTCFREAEKRQVRTLAFPAISTGIFGYPLEQATQIAMGETLRFLEMEDRLLGVFFVCFDGATREVYQREFQKHFPHPLDVRPLGRKSAYGGLPILSSSATGTHNILAKAPTSPGTLNSALPNHEFSNILSNVNQRYAIRVVGQVQGVFFRASARKEARRLGISGWVQNDPDGNVSLEAQAPQPVLQAFIRWCRQGPPSARVESVLTHEISLVEGEKGFLVRR